MRALAVDRSLEAIAGPVVAQTVGPAVSAPLDPLSDRTLCVASKSRVGKIAWSGLGDNGSGTNTVTIRTGSSSGSIHGRHSPTHLTNEFVVPETQPIVAALRLSESLSRMELFVDGIRRTFNMNGDTSSGVAIQKLYLNAGGIFVCLYPRALTDTEIQLVSSWLASRYL